MRFPATVTLGTLTFSRATWESASITPAESPVFFSVSVPSVTISSKTVYRSPYFLIRAASITSGLSPECSAANPIHFRALDSFFHSRILSRRWWSFTSFRERSICPRLWSTWSTLQTTFCPSRIWSRIYLIHPVAISEMGMSPSRPGYSSRDTNAAKSLMSLTVQTTSSPAVGHDWLLIALLTQVFPGSRRSLLPCRRWAQQGPCCRPHS
ncbi:MAG: hypothetical protein BWY93_02335 [Euryarchaeota archaeon ADurb.BinA087]|nr:MAG: hypothetical protein BWY93_02335 [Euryarchaeota archaeon ADurb.BinA087]